MLSFAGVVSPHCRYGDALVRAAAGQMEKIAAFYCGGVWRQRGGA